jgi:hypothetical protein
MYGSIILNLDMDRGELSVSSPGYFILSERAPGTHWKGAWVDAAIGLDSMK